MDELHYSLLDRYQRGFPVAVRPFDAVAAALGCHADAVLAALASLRERRVLARIGATFRPNAVAASTLAALAVPPSRLDAVADLVSGYPEVTHNYEREHRYNLWFVAAAPDDLALRRLLREIETRVRLPALVLPLLADYHLDLGFPLDATGAELRLTPAQRPRCARLALDAPARALVAGLQRGLPLVPRPYATLAEAAGIGEDEALERLAAWVGEGVVQRLGLVLHHHELGFRANAMVVWDVPDERVDEAAGRVASWSFVTLCYRRARQLPDWPYNLFCMVHGRSREETERRLEVLQRAGGMDAYPGAVLFSRRRFKQRAAGALALDRTGDG